MAVHVAYKVLTREECDELRANSFEGAPIDRVDGFIHLSTASQLTETVDRHFAGRQDLVIAAVDLVALGTAVRWEPSRNGELFPHLYAPLPSHAVIAYRPLERDVDGRVQLPA